MLSTGATGTDVAVAYLWSHGVDRKRCQPHSLLPRGLAPVRQPSHCLSHSQFQPVLQYSVALACALRAGCMSMLDCCRCWSCAAAICICWDSCVS